MNRSLENYNRSQRRSSSRRAWIAAATVATASVAMPVATAAEKLQGGLVWLFLGALGVAVGAVIGVGIVISPRKPSAPGKPIVPETCEEQLSQLWRMWWRGERKNSARRVAAGRHSGGAIL